MSRLDEHENLKCQIGTSSNEKVISDFNRRIKK